VRPAAQRNALYGVLPQQGEGRDVVKFKSRHFAAAPAVIAHEGAAVFVALAHRAPDSDGDAGAKTTKWTQTTTAARREQFLELERVRGVARCGL